MRAVEVMVVRIYLSERDARLDRLLERLRKEEGIRGVTVFRGVEGFGNSKALHTARLVDLALDLPVVVEFFDVPGKAVAVIEHLAREIKPDHIVSWRAHTYSDGPGR